MSRDSIPAWAPEVCTAIWRAWDVAAKREGRNEPDVARIKQLLTDQRMKEVWETLGKGSETFFRNAAFAFRGKPTGWMARIHGIGDHLAIAAAKDLQEKLEDGWAPGLLFLEREKKIVSALRSSLDTFISDLAARIDNDDEWVVSPFTLPKKQRDRAKGEPRIFFVKYMSAVATKIMSQQLNAEIATSTNVLFDSNMDERAVKKITRQERT